MSERDVPGERATGAGAGRDDAAGDPPAPADPVLEGAWNAIDASIHDLRTPLSAMSGWLEVLEARAASGDTMGARAMQGLRRAIDQQTRLLDDYAKVSQVQRQWPSAAGRRPLAGPLDLAMQRLESEVAVRLAPASAVLVDADGQAGPLCLDAGERLVDALATLLGLLAHGLGPRGKLSLSIERDALRFDAASIDGDPTALAAFCARPGKAGARAANVGLAVLWSARTVLDRCGVVPGFDAGDAAHAFSLVLRAADRARPGSVALGRSPHAAIGLEAEAPPSGTGPRQEPSLRTVLIVDDQREMRDMLGLWLRCHHFAVVLADSAREARERLAEIGRVSAALIDVRMPDEDGISLMRSIRATERGLGLPPMPALAITAEPSLATRASAIDAGFARIVAKPLKLRRLLDELRALTATSGGR
ncbi:MAG: response regulator [Lautropia sp.]